MRTLSVPYDSVCVCGRKQGKVVSQKLCCFKELVKQPSGCRKLCASLERGQFSKEDAARPFPAMKIRVISRQVKRLSSMPVSAADSDRRE